MRIRSSAPLVLQAFREHSNVFLSDLGWYGDITSTKVNTKTHKTFVFISSASRLLIDFDWLFVLGFFCIWSSCSFRRTDRGESRVQRTRVSWGRSAGGDQHGGGVVGTRGEGGVIDRYMDGETCPSLWGQSRQGEAAPRALYVPDDSQLMSYLGCSTPGIVSKGERSVRELWQSQQS